MVPGLLTFGEMHDVAGLIAPRHLLVVNGRRDELFLNADVEEAVARLADIYAAAGAEDRCHLVVGNGGHRFYAAEAWPVMLNEIARRRGSEG